MTQTEQAIIRAFYNLCDVTNNRQVYWQLEKELDFIAKEQAKDEKFLCSLQDLVNPSGQD